MNYYKIKESSLSDLEVLRDLLGQEKNRYTAWLDIIIQCILKENEL